MTSESEQPLPVLWIAATVRPHHANTFAEEWLRVSLEGPAMTDAFAATCLIGWPSSPSLDETPAQARYNAIEDDILKRVAEAVRPVIMEAFARIAAEVLEREADRQGS